MKFSKCGVPKNYSLQARGDQTVWLKRQQQRDAGHTALVGLMDALLQLQQGRHDLYPVSSLHLPGPNAALGELYIILLHSSPAMTNATFTSQPGNMDVMWQD